MNVKVFGAHVKILQHAEDSPYSSDEFSNNKKSTDPRVMQFKKDTYSSRSSGKLEQDPLLVECNISVKLYIEANADNVTAMEVSIITFKNFRHVIFLI